MSHIAEHHAPEHREPFPPRWVFFVAALMIIVGLGWSVYMQLSATSDKNTAQANSQTLAQDIQTICAAQGKLLVDDKDLCAKAVAVQEKPTEAIPGPKGDPGKDGLPGANGQPGRNGADSTVPGPPGSPGVEGAAGKDGVDGSDGVGTPGADGQGIQGPPGPMGPAGPAGPPGASGSDASATGPAGPAGPPGANGADGKDGATGPQGAEGRGIKTAHCGNDGRWTITYTDGHIADAGQCRAAATPILGAP